MTRKEIPIEKEKKLKEINGIVIEEETVRKGLLNKTTKSIKHDPTGLGWHVLQPLGDDELAVASLLEMKQDAQKILRAAGLPSDLSRPYQVLSVEKKLEPLSLEECAARLIERVDDLLSHKDKMIALHGLRFGAASHDFILAGGLNVFVAEGAKAVEKSKLHSAGGKKGREEAVQRAGEWKEWVGGHVDDMYRNNSSQRGTFIRDAIVKNKKPPAGVRLPGNREVYDFVLAKLKEARARPR